MIQSISLTEKHLKGLVIGLIAFFSFAILWELIFWLRFPMDTRLKTSSLAQGSILHGQPLGQVIANTSIFGIYVPNDLSDDTVKKSLLDVTLVGVLLGDNPVDSQVILRLPGGEEKSYLIGDPLPGGAVIKRIRAHGLLIERNGELESISLPKSQLLFEPVPKPLPEE